MFNLKKDSKTLRKCASLGAFLLLASPVWADILPLHGFVVHLNPYVTPGAVALGPPFGEIVAPVSAGVTHVGADALVAADGWHWQDEIDIFGFPAGPARVVVNGTFQGIVMFGPGTDFIVDFHQPDQAGAIPLLGLLPGPLGLGMTCVGGGFEVGAVCKQFVNLTPFFVAHGVAVEECPDGNPFCAFPPPPPPGPPVFAIFNGPGAVSSLTFVDGPDGPEFRLDKIPPIPEPETYAMLLAGLGLLGFVARRRKRDAVA